MVRVPGKDTALLGIDREAERLANVRGRATRGRARRSRAMLEDPPCLVTEFVDGEALRAEELRAPSRSGRVARRCGAARRSRRRLPIDFSVFRLVEDYATTTAEQAAARLPPGYEDALERSRRDRGGADATPSTSPSPATTTCWRRTSSAARDRIWIVDWEYAGMGDRYFDLGNFAVNNELDDDEEARAARPRTSARAAPDAARPAARRAAADAR